MNKNSRMINSIRNITYGFIGQGLSLLASFICRMVFVRYLSVEYLGINGLFSNILSMLSLAELGIGSAIVFELYKALADNNEEDIASYMYFYSVAYKSIGIIIIIIGFALLPFLNNFIATKPNIDDNLYFLYILYLINTAISYFYSYKGSIFQADQKNYVVTTVNYSVLILQNILQIVVLLTTHNFILYVIIQIIATIINNLVISNLANSTYPIIKKKNIMPLAKIKKKNIFKNVKALIIMKFGNVLVSGTSSIIISAIVGLSATGIISNFTLLTTALDNILNKIYSGITASIGNLNITASNTKKKEVWDVISLVSFWLYGWCSISFIILSNDIVKICFGLNYQITFGIIIVIALNFYTVGMQNVPWSYKAAMGLFNYGKYFTFLTGILNILFSIVLGKFYGIIGILAATLISRMLTYFWYDPYAVYKYGMHENFVDYLKNYAFYIMILIMTCSITFIISNKIQGDFYSVFIIKVILCVIFPNIIFMLCFRKRKEYIYLYSKLENITKNVLHKLNLISN